MVDVLEFDLFIVEDGLKSTIMITVGVSHDCRVEGEAILEVSKPIIKESLLVASLTGIDDHDLLRRTGFGRRKDAAVTLADVEKDQFEQPLLLVIFLPNREGLPAPFYLRPFSIDVVSDPQPITPEELLSLRREI